MSSSPQRKVLVIEASPNGEQSLSKKGTLLVIDALKMRFENIEIKVRDLQQNPVPHLKPELIQAMFTKAEMRSTDMLQTLKLSEELTDELLWADEIIIATPMWNFSVPSVLKAWVDHVSRAGKTFSFTDEGLIGLAAGRKAYVVVASGSVFSEGAFASFDALSPFVKAFFGFIGIPDVHIIRVEGVNDPNNHHNALSKASDTVNSIFV
ncbi:MAG: NAD(P)H-dependent oxidoreductase [Bacteriovoracaceae bacterium]|jgi:FMN-dependent NADH-azoreductase|nr:NAD(P)H-dependent oxidoreductase [Bacteriovoracaceae bacterium]